MMREIEIRNRVKNQEAKRGLYPLNGGTLIGWETEHQVNSLDLFFAQPSAEMVLETLLSIVFLTEAVANSFAAEIVRSTTKSLFHLKVNEDC